MSLKLNLGSGQRPFGLPRVVYNHDAACCICGITVELHRQDTERYRTGPVLPRIFDPHKFVGYGEWINVDCQPKWKPDVVTDIRNMPMFADGSAELIVLHHCLEHFHMAEADKVIAECYRLLGVGGSLIITLPDLKALAVRWIRGEITDYIFFVNCMGADMGDPSDLHRWHYTQEGLQEKLLKQATWLQIKTFDFRQIDGASIAQDFWIQGTEAIK